MAHRIEENDVQEGTEMAWHGLTKVNPQLSLENCILAQWDVEPVVICDSTGRVINRADETDETPEAERGFGILKCTDRDLYIGQPFRRDSYQPITNAKFIEVIKKSLAGTGHTVASVGSVCNRGRIFVSIKLDGLPKFTAGSREFEAYLNFLSSHDLSSVLVATTSNTCTVCNNTFCMNLMHQGKAVNLRVKHTKGALEALENIPAVIDAAIGVQAEFRAAFDELSQKKVDSKTANRLFAGIIVPDFKPLTEIQRAELIVDGEMKPEVSTRSQNVIEKHMALFFDRRKGNKGEDLSDVFSAVTDYHTHESAGGNLRKQIVNSEFGTGVARKREAFTILRDDELLAKAEETGAKVLEAIARN